MVTQEKESGQIAETSESLSEEHSYTTYYRHDVSILTARGFSCGRYYFLVVPRADNAITLLLDALKVLCSIYTRERLFSNRRRSTVSSLNRQD
jgi:hypothetical protein